MSDNGVVRSRSPKRGAARWREICEEYERFIGTQAEFCRLHGITCGSLRYWRLKQEAASDDRNNQGFNKCSISPIWQIRRFGTGGRCAAAFRPILSSPGFSPTDTCRDKSTRGID